MDDRVGKGKSFNRYIVECKYCKKDYEIQHWSVLIDTQWNVNKIADDIANEIEEVLIDTQWNVNK